MERLTREFYDLEHRLDGESGLEALSDSKFDLVLMDINLGKGKMDGVETMKRLKQIPGYEKIPVMAVTSYALPEDESRFISLGFDDYLAKPVDRAILLERIHTLLKR
jgi:CheY-like chemotaxis protein